MTNMDRELSELIECVYATVSETDRWPEVMRRYSDFVSCDNSNLIGRSAGRQAWAAPFGFDPHFHQSYIQYYHRFDLFHRMDSPPPTGTVMLHDEIFAQFGGCRTEFYNDWLAPQHLVHGIGFPVHLAPGVVVGVISSRATHKGPSDESARHRSRLVVPHFHRALLLAHQIGAIRAEQKITETTLDHIAVAMFLLDEQMRIVRTNAAADRLLASRDGLYSGPDGLYASSSAVTAGLRRAIAEASRTTRGAGLDGGGVLRVPRTKRGPLSLVVTPVCRDLSIWGQATTRAAILAFDSDDSSESAAQWLVERHGLTATEVSLTHLVASGLSPKEAAAKRQVSIHTVRRQLESIYKKTAARGLADLVRIVVTGTMKRERQLDLNYLVSRSSSDR